MSKFSIACPLDLTTADQFFGDETRLEAGDDLIILKNQLLDRASEELVPAVARSVLQFSGKRLAVTTDEIEGWTTSKQKIESADVGLTIHGPREDLLALIRNPRFLDRWNVTDDFSAEGIAEIEELITESRRSRDLLLELMHASGSLSKMSNRPAPPAPPVAPPEQGDGGGGEDNHENIARLLRKAGLYVEGPDEVAILDGEYNYGVTPRKNWEAYCERHENWEDLAEVACDKFEDILNTAGFQLGGVGGGNVDYCNRAFTVVFAFWGDPYHI
jgi:hypothetical protein